MHQSYEKTACKILRYLNDCYEYGVFPSKDSLNHQKLRITQLTFYQTMEMMVDDDYDKGVVFSDTIPPELSTMNSPDNWRITSKGIEYFKENKLIRKAYRELEKIRDWIPIVKP